MAPQLEHIISEYGPMLSRIAASYEYDADLQKDLLQETALAIWQGLKAFEGRASIKTYVARIAHYQGVNHVRKSAQRPKTAPLDEDMTGDQGDRAEKNLMQNRLMQAVRQLPLPLRQVATLALEGFEAREIAEALGISANNAAVRLNRAKAALKEELHDDG